MPRRQRGIVAVMVAMGLLILLGVAGLAIDLTHLTLNKSRLQSTVDAAALAAAKVLDETRQQDDATAAARAVFDRNADDQPELKEVLSGADITVQYSETLNPFAPGTEPANYVRVRVDNFSMWASFVSLFGFDELGTGASAVSGPSAPIREPCELVPMTVCGDVNAGAPDYGFTTSSVTLLKLASQAAGSTIGPGNFQLIRLGGGGADVVREGLAGGYQGCVEDDLIEVQPGVAQGPVRDGLNTRFGIYHGGIARGDYPPDHIVRATDPPLTSDGTHVYSGGVEVTPENMATTVTYDYADYLQDYADGNYNPNVGKPMRRVIAVPVVDCREPEQGHGFVPWLTFSCFYLLQPITQHAGGSEGYVFAQYVEECRASGEPGPTGGPGVYTIVLHNDPDSPDS